MKNICTNGILALVLFIALCLLVLFALSQPAHAQTLNWHTANQVTVAWDVENATEGLTFEVFLAPPDRTGPVSAAVVSEMQATITLPEEGQYLIGVQTIRTVDGQEAARSAVSWSDDPAWTDGVPFGVMYYLAPPPINLRLQ